jgi:hypothetical protein
MGWIIGGSSPGRGWILFSSPSRPDRLWGPTSLLSNGYQGVKWLGYEADHLSPYSAEVKNAWNYTFTPQYAFMAWCSIKKLWTPFNILVRLLRRGIGLSQSLYLHRTTQHRKTPRRGFEPTIPMFERSKTTRTLNRTASGTGVRE